MQVMKQASAIKKRDMLKRICAQRGFTLVEMLVYMGIFAILITLMAHIFTSIVDTQLSSEATTSVAQDGQYLYSRFIYDIHSADAIVTPEALGETGSVLTLTKDGTNYTYSLDGDVLMVHDGTAGYALNSFETGISDLQFQRIGNIGGKHTVRITFTVTGKTVLQSGPEVRHFQTTAGLR